MADSGIKSKRRWAQWLCYLAALLLAIKAQVQAVCPPDHMGWVELVIAIIVFSAGYLAQSSKNKQ
jgi:uncharacterized membrane protein